MNETKPPPLNGLIIADHLNQEQIQLLAKLILGIKKDTGYGHVKLIIEDKRVVRLKAEKSY